MSDPFALLDGGDLGGGPDPRTQMVMLPFWLRDGLKCVAFAIYLEASWRQSGGHSFRSSTWSVTRRNFLEKMVELPLSLEEQFIPAPRA